MPRPLREYRPARPGGLLVPSPLEQQSCESVERLHPAVRVNPPPCRPGRYARRALDPVAPREVPHPVLHLRPAVCGIVLREGTRARFRTEEIGCGHTVRVRLARAELRRRGFAPFTEPELPESRHRRAVIEGVAGAGSGGRSEVTEEADLTLAEAARGGRDGRRRGGGGGRGGGVVSRRTEHDVFERRPRAVHIEIFGDGGRPVAFATVSI
mmetsp:Transcript_41989/g.82326  ORF Transcript_41989/g.82326 Transcript_41989/m.82326 type:complete len:211 (+) Transcript_41989:432-1064(+)